MSAVERALGRVGFVGAGAVATALASAMTAAGVRVDAVGSRTMASAERLAAGVAGCVATSPQGVADACDTVFLTVPDDAIAQVASTLRWRAGQAVVHCSGAAPLDALSAAADAGADVGAFHPLQTFPGMSPTAAADAGADVGAFHPLQTFPGMSPTSAADAGADVGAFQPLQTFPGVPPTAAAGASPTPVDADGRGALAGVAFAVEAAAPLRGALESLAERLGGWCIVLHPGDRALYHASAVAACGLAATLFALAADLWSSFPPAASERAAAALLPLARSTLENIERQGMPAALTGPAARGDVGVVQLHLDALSARAPAFLPVYCALTLASLPLAREKGSLSVAQESQLRALLVEQLRVDPGNADAQRWNEGAQCA